MTRAVPEMAFQGRFAMLFIVIGLLLIGLKFADIAPVAAMSWWWVDNRV